MRSWSVMVVAVCIAGCSQRPPVREQLMDAISEAAAVDAEASRHGKGADLAKPRAQHTLTFVLLATDCFGSYDIQWPVDLAPESFIPRLRDKITSADKVNLLRRELIKGLDFTLSDDGKRAQGTVEVECELYKLTTRFEARQEGDDWRVETFTLPGTARQVRREETGGWRLVDLPTDNPLTAYRRATLGSYVVHPFTISGSGVPINTATLSEYGQLRRTGAQPVALAKEGKGTLLAIGADASFEELLELGDIALQKARPVAVVSCTVADVAPLTSPDNGVEFPERLFRLPRIARVGDKPGDDTPALVGPYAVYAGSFDLIPITKVRLTNDDRYKPLLNGKRCGGLNDLTSRLILWNARDSKMIVAIVADRDVQVKYLVGAMDSCLRAGVPLGNVIIDARGESASPGTDTFEWP